MQARLESASDSGKLAVPDIPASAMVSSVSPTSLRKRGWDPPTVQRSGFGLAVSLTSPSPVDTEPQDTGALDARLH